MEHVCAKGVNLELVCAKCAGLVFGVFGGFISPALLLHTKLIVSLFIMCIYTMRC